MNKKYVMVSLEEDRIKNIAEVLGNKTCKKIIDFLAEVKEASEKDIADNLNIPLNTAEYNLKKLLDSGLIEKTKNFFWSVKGKKIPMYKISNKSIVISPKSKISSELKLVLPIAILSGLSALIIRQYYIAKNFISFSKDEMLAKSAETFSSASGIAQKGSETILATQPVWLWFLAGAIFSLFIFSVIQLLKGGNKNG